jgi:hypothetical protein
MKEVGRDRCECETVVKKVWPSQKLNDRITGKIEPPKDNEIEQFFNSNSRKPSRI